MTRQQRRSKSQYLNACRKLGYRPSKGFVYRRGRWCRRFRFTFSLYADRITVGCAGLGEWTLAEVDGEAEE